MVTRGRICGVFMNEEILSCLPICKAKHGKNKFYPSDGEHFLLENGEGFSK